MSSNYRHFLCVCFSLFFFLLYLVIYLILISFFFQSIITKCQEDDKDVLLDKDKREIVKQYLALPLLPAEHIVTGHLVITDYLNRSLINNFWTLNDYFGQYWMDLIGPSVFSVYETRNNVNDSVELFHNRMKHNLGSRKTMWSFVGKFNMIINNLNLVDN